MCVHTGVALCAAVHAYRTHAHAVMHTCARTHTHTHTRNRNWQVDKLEPILTSNRGTRQYNEAEKLKWLLSKEQIKQFGQATACLYQKKA